DTLRPTATRSRCSSGSARRTSGRGGPGDNLGRPRAPPARHGRGRQTHPNPRRPGRTRSPRACCRANQGPHNEPLLARPSRLNQTGVFLATVAFVFVALLLPGPVGGVLLLALAAGLGWLLWMTWPHHASRSRAYRVVILVLLVVLALAKLVR